MAKDEAKWAYWGKHIEAWRASGLSRHAYCEREGLKPTTFDYWRPLIVTDHAGVETVKQAVSGNGITLVPVEVDRSRADNPSTLIQLKSPSGWEIQLPSNVNSGWLIDLLRQLA